MIPQLNFHHLLYFWTVAREGGIQPAARRLNLTQPTISAQLKSLEEAFGQKLFRRTGRKLALTDAGQTVLGYADEIFSLGNELLLTMGQDAQERAVRLHVGVADSVPKLLVRKILRPVMTSATPSSVVCREGNLSDLVSSLGHYRLDIVLAEEPAVSSMSAQAFNHRLGRSAIALCASPELQAKLKRGFPKSLNGAPAILPTPEMPMRRLIEAWFSRHAIQPRIVGEIEDSALMKDLAADGAGFLPMHAALLDQAKSLFGFKLIGMADGPGIDLYAITAERRVNHPFVSQILKERIE